MFEALKKLLKPQRSEVWVCNVYVKVFGGLRLIYRGRFDSVYEAVAKGIAVRTNLGLVYAFSKDDIQWTVKRKGFKC